jgi:hypothetical protein
MNRLHNFQLNISIFDSFHIHSRRLIRSTWEPITLKVSMKHTTKDCKLQITAKQPLHGASLSVNCETRKTKLIVSSSGDYMLLKKDKQQASRP